MVERLIDASDDEDLLPDDGATMYKKIVGSLLYLAICTRPDLAYACSALGQFTHRPSRQHLEAAFRVLRYVHHTQDLGIHITGAKELVLDVFCDSDHASDVDRISRSAWICRVGGVPISWQSKKTTICLSSAESEFVAASLAGTEAIHLQALVYEMVNQQRLNESVKLGPTLMKIDNLPCIRLLRQEGSYCSLKHVDIRLKWVTAKAVQRRLTPIHVPGRFQLADLLTKPLGRVRFTFLVDLLDLQRGTGCTTSG
jgi:hypothetical protein